MERSNRGLSTSRKKIRGTGAFPNAESNHFGSEILIRKLTISTATLDGFYDYPNNRGRLLSKSRGDDALAFRARIV